MKFYYSLYVLILTFFLMSPLRAADSLPEKETLSDLPGSGLSFQKDFPDSMTTPLFLLRENLLPQRSKSLLSAAFAEDSALVLPLDSILSCYTYPDSSTIKITVFKKRPGLLIRDSLVIYRPPLNFYGEDSINFTVQIDEFRDTLIQHLEIYPVNDAPSWGKKLYTEIKSPEDEILNLPKSWLYERAGDPETPDTSLYYHAVSGEHVHISLESNRITIVPDENWFGSDTLLLIVSDGELSDSTRLPLRITPVNDRPVLYPLPDIVINEDDTLYIDKNTLVGFAEDIEMPNSQLKWQALRLGRIRAFYDGAKIRITAPENWFGLDSIRLTVSDGELSAERIWKIRFLPVNDPPRWLRSVQRSIFEDDTLRIQKREFYKIVRDPETKPADLQWELIPDNDLTLRESDDAYECFAPPDWYGKSYINMIIGDGEYYDTSRMLVRIISVNDPPVLQALPAQQWNEDDTLTLSRRYLNTFVKDVETKSEDLLWHFFPETPLFVRQSTGALKFYAAPDWNGKSNIKVVVSDGGLRDTSIIAVNVLPLNDAPRWETLPDTVMYEDKPMTLPLDFIRRYVSDPDTKDSISLNISAGEEFFMEEKNDTLIIWPTRDWFGKETLTLKASDGKKSSSVRWNIPVLPVNDPPYFTANLPDSLSFYANSSDTLFMEDIIYDIDNKFSELSWEITPGRIVRYLINDEKGSIIFYTESNKSGEDAITIRVTDGHDMIVYYMPVYVHEVDRFLVANPEKLELLPNSPNPFRDYTDIRYSLPVGAHVSIRIYDLLGKEIKELVNEYHDAANYTLRWFGENESGVSVPSGVYLCRMDALVEGEPRVLMRKMMLVR